VGLQEGSFTGVAAAAARAGGGSVAPDDEVLLRSLQLAAAAPVMLAAPPVDAADPRHAPWFALHEELGPYLEDLATTSLEDGLPQLRPMALRYGDLRASHDLWDQYLLGDDLLVAPVTEVGVRERRVWFPPGRWVSLWDDDQVVEGPLDVVVDAPLDQIPLFGREGSDVLDVEVPTADS
jgi:alpha-glucosidase (family GH31 glycosyl hydrolase)